MYSLEQLFYTSSVEVEKNWTKVKLEFLWWAWDMEKWVNLTGSATKLTIEFPDWKKYIGLIDFGMFQWCENALRYNEILPFNLAEIDFVIVTHTHIDHIWKLLHFSKDEFRWKVVTTSINSEVMMVMLKDIINLQQKEEEKNLTPKKKLERKLENLKKLKLKISEWNDEDIDDFAQMIEDIENELEDTQEEDRQFFKPEDLQKVLGKTIWMWFYEKIEVKNDVEAVFLPAWHLPGSAQAIVKVKVWKNEYITLWFSGDLWKIKNPAVWWKPENPREEFDLFVIESTYAWRLHPEIHQEEQKFIKAIKHAIKNNWKVFIPVFMQWRAQEVALYLHKLQQEGKIPKIPIFYHSDSIKKINEIYQRHYPDYFGKLNEILQPAVKWRWKNKIYYFDSYEKPAILLASWWMLNGGTIMSYIGEITDSANAFVAVGYQSQDTLWNEIFVEKAENFKADGIEYKVNAYTEKVSLFSWHADEKDLYDFVRQIKLKEGWKIIINHWEKSEELDQFGLGVKKIVGPTKQVLLADLNEIPYKCN